MNNLVDLQTVDPLLNHCRICSEVYTMKMWFFIMVGHVGLSIKNWFVVFLFQVNEKRELKKSCMEVENSWSKMLDWVQKMNGRKEYSQSFQ
jgi:hypothetical protein